MNPYTFIESKNTQNYTDVIKTFPAGTFFDYPFCGCNEHLTESYYTLPECNIPPPSSGNDCIEGADCFTPCHLKHVATNGSCTNGFDRKYDPSEYSYDYQLWVQIF